MAEFSLPSAVNMFTFFCTLLFVTLVFTQDSKNKIVKTVNGDQSYGGIATAKIHPAKNQLEDIS